MVLASVLAMDYTASVTKTLAHNTQRTCAALAALLLTATIPAVAQRVPTNYRTTTYYKIAPENTAAFLAWNKEEGRKLIMAGQIKSSSLWKLLPPFTVGSDYNYVTLATSEKYPDPDPAVTQPERYPPVRQEVGRVRLRVGPVPEPGDYLRIDYHIAPEGRANELLSMEETIYAPAFAKLLESNKDVRGWTVTTPVYPTPSEVGYSLYTAEILKTYSALVGGLGMTQEFMQKVHPNLDPNVQRQQWMALDRFVKTRIYRLIDLAGTVLPGAPMK